MNSNTMNTMSKMTSRITQNINNTISRSKNISPSMSYSKDLIKWILIIVILAILGLNIFNYLASGTSLIANTAVNTANIGLNTVGQSIEMSKQGVDSIVKQSNNNGKSTNQSELQKIEKALDIGIVNKRPDFLKPDDSSSNIQLPKKSGYCYIGEDKGGYRSCLYVGKRDECMSGDIFPSMEVCINPNLRA